MFLQWTRGNLFVVFFLSFIWIFMTDRNREFVNIRGRIKKFHLCFLFCVLFSLYIVHTIYFGFFLIRHKLKWEYPIENTYFSKWLENLALFFLKVIKFSVLKLYDKESNISHSFIFFFIFFYCLKIVVCSSFCIKM